MYVQTALQMNCYVYVRMRPQPSLYALLLLLRKLVSKFVLRTMSTGKPRWIWGATNFLAVFLSKPASEKTWTAALQTGA